MKPFDIYQYLDGEEMTDRDKIEVGSKFWNKGKWDNFVDNLIKDVNKDMTFVDIGCNKGLFLYLAQEKGFGTVIGVDSCKEAIDKGLAWREEHGGKYRFFYKRMEECLDELPVADYIVLANTHYYFTINDWLDFLDKLQYKTRYVIIVTAEKHHKNLCWASADLEDIRGYFKDWENVGFIDCPDTEGDPMPRKLWSFCYQSPHLKRVDINLLKSHNVSQDTFWGEIDKGVDFKETAYYKNARRYRRRWSEDHLNDWFAERIAIYLDLKKNGLKRPIYLNSENMILDGNHRYSGLKHLGYKSVIVRYV